MTVALLLRACKESRCWLPRLPWRGASRHKCARGVHTAEGKAALGSAAEKVTASSHASSASLAVLATTGRRRRLHGWPKGMAPEDFGNLVNTELYRTARRVFCNASLLGHAKPARALPKRLFSISYQKLLDEMASVNVAAVRGGVPVGSEDRKLIALLKARVPRRQLVQVLGVPWPVLRRRAISLLSHRHAGTFSSEEDALILSHAARFGKQFSFLSARMGLRRSVYSLRARWQELTSESLPNVAWTEEDRRRFLELVAAPGNSLALIASRLKVSESLIYRLRKALFVVPEPPLADDDVRLLVDAVARHGRDFAKIAADVLPLFSPPSLARAYDKFLPPWLRPVVDFQTAARVLSSISADGSSERVFVETACAVVRDSPTPLSVSNILSILRAFVALELGADDPSHIDWRRFDLASGAERRAALDAFRRQILPTTAREAWTHGARLVVFAKMHDVRPIGLGRSQPIAAVANHPSLKPFLALSKK